MSRIPVSIHAAVTPNPNVIKFIADRFLIEPLTASVDFRNKEEAEGYSPLAVAAFNQFTYVRGVYIAKNFISVTKDETEMAWDYLISEVRDFLWSYIVEGNPIVEKFPEEREAPATKEGSEYAPSKFDKQIKELMKKYVENPVQGDGGEIIFRNFKDGVVTVLLKGACVACPARNKTLKSGIESILMKYIPEVKEVVAENGGDTQIDEQVEGEWSDSYL